MEHQPYTLRLARKGELPLLQAVQMAAVKRFYAIGLLQGLDIQPVSLERLQDHLEQGGVWVAADAADRPVGFADWFILDGCAHLNELDVLPTHGRRGLGQRLVEQCCRWACEQRLPAVTLSTFRTVAWNGPFYTRLGFRFLEEHELTPGLQHLRILEAQFGLLLTERVCMRRELT
ncbi:MAG: GNAT family N-acetyltransferase [Chloroflexaceae bacterium]|nr:GNAT family N-acetyltransferase [Chloroflexaceae bacterium]